MTISRQPATRPDAEAGRILSQVDSVYFLLFPGWEDELRSNRWHFAVRWAKRKPVVLVNPVRISGGATSVPERRVPNCSILNVQLVGEPNLLAKRHIQAAQVMAHMTQEHHTRPLLWSYNPELIETYASVPAVARVYHASENYFDLPGPGPAFHQRVRATVAISDLTVAVSQGVADGIGRHVDGADVVTVTNGCDFAHYSGGRPDAVLVAEGRSFERIAVYAGNVNVRLDFELLLQLATRHPEVLFAVYGPVKNLGRADTEAWRKFAAMRNVTTPGPVDPDRIRDLYAAADVGIIPYRDEPWLVENGLPLKALEMCATGLPAVSTLMKPLLGLTRGLVVTTGQDEFLTAFAGTSRRALAADVVSELARVSEANDYDVKFDQIIEAVSRRRPAPLLETRIDRLVATDPSQYVADEARFSEWLAMPVGARLLGWFIHELVRLVPERARVWLRRTRLRKSLRGLLGG